MRFVTPFLVIGCGILLVAGWALRPSQLAEASPERRVLRIFAGGSSQRPDLLEAALVAFQAEYPSWRVEVHTGGATSELQRRYLSTLLAARDSTYDVLLLDVMSPPQYAAAGWIAPLTPLWDGELEGTMEEFWPALQQACKVGDQWTAVPAQIGTMVLFYRKDLLERHHRQPPETWAELEATANHILAAEQDSRLSGISFQGAPIEGSVCTFLLPYWSAGHDLLDERGGLALDLNAARASLDLYLGLVRRGVSSRHAAETKTGDTMNAFLDGRCVFAIAWSPAYELFDRSPLSKVAGSVGLTKLPRLEGGSHVTALGGWLWAVSAYSRHQVEAAALVRHLTSPSSSLGLALQGGIPPTRPTLYQEQALLEHAPWMRDLIPILETARPRPSTPRYGEVSDTLRVAFSAVLAGAQTPAEGVSEMDRRLRRILR